MCAVPGRVDNINSSARTAHDRARAGCSSPFGRMCERRTFATTNSHRHAHMAQRTLPFARRLLHIAVRRVSIWRPPMRRTKWWISHLLPPIPGGSEHRAHRRGDTDVAAKRDATKPLLTARGECCCKKPGAPESRHIILSRSTRARRDDTHMLDIGDGFTCEWLATEVARKLTSRI